MPHHTTPQHAVSTTDEDEDVCKFVTEEFLAKMEEYNNYSQPVTPSTHNNHNFSAFSDSNNAPPVFINNSILPASPQKSTSPSLSATAGSTTTATVPTAPLSNSTIFNINAAPFQVGSGTNISAFPHLLHHPHFALQQMQTSPQQLFAPLPQSSMHQHPSPLIGGGFHFLPVQVAAGGGMSVPLTTSDGSTVAIPMMMPMLFTMPDTTSVVVGHHHHSQQQLLPRQPTHDEVMRQLAHSHQNPTNNHHHQKSGRKEKSAAARATSMLQLHYQQQLTASGDVPTGEHSHEHNLSTSSSNPNIVEVFDPTYRFCFEVPIQHVIHLPPARMNITRFVFCRNYVRGDPSSCNVGDGCKFVHVDVDIATLQAHSVHVKYAWRSEDVCTYARLPPGEILQVAAPNNRPPTDDIPSERVLVTQGSLRRHDTNNISGLSHCAHYYFNRMCNRGEMCHFVHMVHVDPTVAGDFKRTPARCAVSIPRTPGLDPKVSGGRRSPQTSSAVTTPASSTFDLLLSPFETTTKMFSTEARRRSPTPKDFVAGNGDGCRSAP
ncbi:Hypothetical protein, putative [Bodo saltans]|uniref:C3H1-type domain-containing protein n=1 Tax=Bodo saltans TaxID=75058 RepID=A0A0S4J8X1_BODSA|nr:Hypothetical protein, putative [Bodo saltans]|eukprot:CUG86559.1 Hypothetical protein, putative [Bodo saltans]